MKFWPNALDIDSDLSETEFKSSEVYALNFSVTDMKLLIFKESLSSFSTKVGISNLDGSPIQPSGLLFNGWPLTRDMLR